MTSPASDLDIDQLAAAVREEPTPANFARLWRAVFTLERWYLIPTGSPDDPRPMLGLVEEQSYLLVFTSERHVKGFAVDQGGVREGRGVAVMTISPMALTNLAPNLIEQGVSGVLFDQGQSGFAAPVAGLQSLHDQFSDKPRSSTPHVGPEAAADPAR
ncbi:MAG: hypothetical protein ABS81_07005 [Pseudonocardia sp. SCN 72-86]|nr:MAG: hypothetical protein ABS81_07005 [Pseudonocardia sp. SCN 72-86]